MVFDSVSRKRVRWTIFGMSILAFIFAVVVISNCRYVLIGFEDTDRSDLSGFGLFRYDVGDDKTRCVAYEDEAFDAPAKTAKAFGVIAALCAGVACVIVVSMQLFLRIWSKTLWLTLRILFLIATFCTILTYTIFATESCKDVDQCTMGAAGIIATFNIALLIAMAVLSFLVPPPPHPTFMVTVHESNNTDPTRPSKKQGPRDVEDPGEQEEMAADRDSMPEPGQVTIEETMLPDGTKKTVKTTVNMDGTMTIEETIEMMAGDG